MICDDYKQVLPAICIHQYRATERYIVASENGKKFSIDNIANNVYMKIRIDGCVITSAEKKCDYLIINCNDNVFFFVELKGVDCGTGVKQLCQTITSFAADSLLPLRANAKSIRVYAVLVAQSIPNIRSSASASLIALVKKYGGDFIQRSRTYELMI